jgi:gamma-glutamyltranspeptidase/glutathione hydrolase
MADWYNTSTTKHSTSLTSGTEVLDDDDDDGWPFHSRRSPVLSRNAAVATSQPLASAIGIELLRQNANAAEAAIGIAAALAVTEPCSTGVGGDMFCLYYDAQQRKVTCINGSGRSPSRLTKQTIEDWYSNRITDKSNVTLKEAFRDSPLSVTVPGAVAGWEDLWKTHGSGRFTLSQLLEPAAKLAEEGFPVAPVTAHHWKSGLSQITKWIYDNNDDEGTSTSTDKTLLPPLVRENLQPGDVIVNRDLANVLREIGVHGAQSGFYQGRAGKAIVQVLKKHGGCMELSDLTNHTSDFPDPISTEYRGCQLWQAPPNGQGIAGLIALAGLRHMEEKGIIHEPISPSTIGSADAYHAMMEMMRLGFADARAHVSDPGYMKMSTSDLLDSERIGRRAESLFDATSARIHGIPDASSCTVSFQVVDTNGNAVSFVNSNFQGFGTGIIPDGCGFTLQNRGCGFTLDDDEHPNAVGPNKRPYHTIIPGILTHTDTGELYATISNMGGNMQPQGHLQLTVDMLAGNMDPQAAIDMPRFCIQSGTQNGTIYFEDGVDERVIEELKRRGHKMTTGLMGHKRALFGRAQIIKRDRRTGVLWAGSDGRADGCAIGF